MTHTLPQLQFEYNALEPYMDEQTVRIHHGKHHQTYVDKLNAVLQNHAELQNLSVEEIVKTAKTLPKDVREGVINFGGGHLNHSFFWQILKKDVPLSGAIAEAINKKFKSFDRFKEQFSAESASLFGSGWTWLVLKKGKLKIVSTANQESPLSKGQSPLLVIDVWEHAYYLRYQNRRAEYISNFFNLINWEKVNELLEKAKSQPVKPSEPEPVSTSENPA